MMEGLGYRTAIKDRGTGEEYEREERGESDEEDKEKEMLESGSVRKLSDGYAYATDGVKRRIDGFVNRVFH
ncbi:hypothetical protein HYC85_021956 [Camellia sinensis]|uniref:Uncharacterized protein n=1 Tax=Camellia sinensis TaxID=4442 RepID=A0A7J7GIZ6_CAMSI|nr:hypothetical protein HYC85_021956 [Camellia sinensis]